MIQINLKLASFVFCKFLTELIFVQVVVLPNDAARACVAGSGSKIGDTCAAVPEVGGATTGAGILAGVGAAAAV